MSRTTFQGAIAELHGLLADATTFAPVAALEAAGVKRVYPYEPGAAGIVKPCSITLSPASVDPTEWTVDVRIYVDAASQPPATAQDLLIGTWEAVSALLLAGAAYGPDTWRFDYVDALDCWVGTSSVMIGREDGF